MPQQNFITKTFNQAQSRFEIAITFPQGARTVKVKGGDSGKSGMVNISFSVEISHDETNWTEVAPILLSGTFKDGFTLREQYKGTTGIVDPTNKDACYNSELQPLHIRIKRKTVQVVDEETAKQVEDDREIRYYYNSTLQSITGFRDGVKAVIDPKGTKLAKTALSVQATKQLNGRIEGINAIAQTFTYDWVSTNLLNPTAGSWQLRNTSNPASLFRYVLTHPGNPQRILESEIESKIDLVKLQYWHNYCNTQRSIVINTNYNTTPPTPVQKTFKLEYNNVLSNVTSVLNILRDICAAGRASPALVDGKWSVNIDEPKEVVQHFTPHNSWGFESVRNLPKLPDALKIKFYNEEADYKEDELILYNDGYGQEDNLTNNIKAAELFESITLPGVTNSAQAADHGKWHYAQMKLRPELYKFNTDVEYLVCNRGDRVKVLHDVPMWGIGSGRIKNRFKNGAVNNDTVNTSTCFELDEDIFIDESSSKNYTMRVRSSIASSESGELVSVTGTLIKQFPVASWSYIGSIVTLIMSSPEHPLQVGENIIVGISPINVLSATITSVSGQTVQYEKTGLLNTGNGVGGSVTRTTGYYNKIQVQNDSLQSTEFQYDEAAPGDLFLFGELNRESNDLIILSVEPISNSRNAQLTLVDYGVTNTYNIFSDYQDLTNITYETLVTNINASLIGSLGSYVPQVDSTKIVSDIRAARLISPGVYEYGILVPFTAPPGVPDTAEYVEADYHSININHLITTAVPPVSGPSGSITITGVEKGKAYRFRLRYLTATGIAGNWSPWYTSTVDGKLNGPEDVAGFTVTQKETGLNFTWTPCVVPDYATTIIKYTEGTAPANDSTSLNAAWNASTTELLFEGNSSTWSWLQPPDGNYNFLIKHKDIYGNESITPALQSSQYDGVSIARVQVEFTNDNHQIPTDSNGLNANLIFSGTDVYVYYGDTPLTYDTVGSEPGTWKIASFTSTTVTPGALQPLTNLIDGDPYATIGDLEAISPTADIASILFSIEGKDLSGKSFTLTKQQKFVKQKNGQNTVLYRINSSTPVVYKNTPDSTTPGDFSRIIVEGRKYEGNTPGGELFGWLGITSYTGETQNGSEFFVFQSINVIPPSDNPSTRWVVKLYNYNSTTYNGETITAPPQGTAVLDQEEITVIFEGEVYIVEIESTNGTVFRVGQDSTTTLKARVFKNGIEITDSIPAAKFKWRRSSALSGSSPEQDDATWNATTGLSGVKQITVDIDDINSRATFFCDILS